MQHKVNLTKRN